MKVKVANVHSGKEMTFEGSEDSIRGQLFAQYSILREQPSQSLLELVDALDSRQSYIAEVDADANEMARMIDDMDNTSPVRSNDAELKSTPALAGCQSLPEGLSEFWAPEDD